MRARQLDDEDRMRRIIAFAVFAAAAQIAAAQQKAPAHPADPAAPAPAVRYESALSGYRGFREEALVSWRDANDEVARIGGHVGIVGGAGRGVPAAKPAAPAAGTAPAPTPK